MQRSKMLWMAPSRVVGTVFLAFCSYVPLSHAGVIVDNTSAYTSSVGGVNPWAQVFTMPGDTSGDVSVLTLQLHNFASGSAEVYIYDATGGAPVNPFGAGQYLYDLGSVSSVSGGSVTITDPSADLLSAGNTYAVVMLPASGASWNYNFEALNSGSGTLGDAYSYSFGVWFQQSSYDALQMHLEVSAVPEVPMTGLAMGLGSLAIGMGHVLRRRFAGFLPSLV